MAILDEALDILKANNESVIAYAKFSGYAIALMDLKSAQMLLDAVKKGI